jgi:hypothetical protein
MILKIFGAVLLIVLGVFGGYVLASNPRILNYFHPQQTTARPVATDELLPQLDAEAKYRLQERCADRAKKFYEEEYAPNSQTMNQFARGGIYLDVYESHFNARLNGCFIFEQLKFIATKGETSIITMEVRDVITRQTYALYTGSMCDVYGTTCKSEFEWWHLVKPYIEELALP